MIQLTLNGILWGEVCQSLMSTKAPLSLLAEDHAWFVYWQEQPTIPCMITGKPSSGAYVWGSTHWRTCNLLPVHASLVPKGSIAAWSSLMGPQETITQFQGPHRYLSNFYPYAVGDDGVGLTVEHAFQAKKFSGSQHPEADTAYQRIVDARWPSEAKRIARAYKRAIRDDWYQIAGQTMWNELSIKFDEASKLLDKLSRDSQGMLIEGNPWDDDWWGVPFQGRDQGRGFNLLGQMLICQGNANHPWVRYTAVGTQRIMQRCAV